MIERSASPETRQEYTVIRVAFLADKDEKCGFAVVFLFDSEVGIDNMPFMRFEVFGSLAII